MDRRQVVAVSLRWDHYPCQAERDKVRDHALQEHRDAQVQRQEEFESQLRRMLDGDRKWDDSRH